MADNQIMKAQTPTKTQIISQIESLKSELSLIMKHEDLLDNDCTIMCRKNRGSTRLYLVGKDRKEKYLSLANGKEIRKHAQRRYNREIRKAALREIAQLDRCLCALENNRNGIADINEVYNSLPDVLKPYVNPGSVSDEKYAREWQESNIVIKYKSIHKQDDYHRYKTIRGDYVGSKSEVIIADRLFANNIPYHYEVAFIPEVEVDKTLPVYDEWGRLAGYEAPLFDPRSRDTLHPDFYVLNKRTRKAYFWEHLGRLDNPDYCRTNLNRLIRYIDAGYTIGEDVLITHEDSQNPLRTESIDEIIEKYLK